MLLPDRSETLTAWRGRGGQIAAVFPVHHPRALWRAHGLLPMEVWAPSSVDVSRGNAHLQAYTCGVVRRGLAAVESGMLDEAAILAVPHACDSLQGLGSLLLDLRPPAQPVLTLYLPRHPGPAGTRYLAQELRALSAAVLAHTGKEPAPGALMEAITREERADSLLSRLLYTRIAAGDAARYHLARAREYLPAEEWIPLVEGGLDEPGDPPEGVPVILSGVLPEPALLDALEEAGAAVVGDDTLCLGRRTYQVGHSDEPFERLAQGLRSGPPCETLGATTAQRAAHLRELAARTGARAVLFWEASFCEPESVVLPQLRAALDEVGLASAVVEVDPGEPLPQQAVTRLEALLEVIS